MRVSVRSALFVCGVTCLPAERPFLRAVLPAQGLLPHPLPPPLLLLSAWLGSGIFPAFLSVRAQLTQGAPLDHPVPSTWMGGRCAACSEGLPFRGTCSRLSKAGLQEGGLSLGPPSRALQLPEHRPCVPQKVRAGANSTLFLANHRISCLGPQMPPLPPRPLQRPRRSCCCVLLNTLPIQLLFLLPSLSFTSSYQTPRRCLPAPRPVSASRCAEWSSPTVRPRSHSNSTSPDAGA